MQKKAKKVLNILLVATIILGSFDYSFANTHNLENDTSQKSEKISQELRSIMTSENQYYDVMILFKKKASISKAKKISKQFATGESDKLKEKKAILGEMQQVATESQDEIIDYLEKEKEVGNVKKFESFFIVNSMNLVAKKSVIDYISGLDEVELISINEVLKLDKPVEIEKDTKHRRVRRQALGELKSSDEIEWNIKNIDADNAWEEGITGKGVTIGILDSAVDVNHPALRRKFKGYNEQNDTVDYTGNFIDCVDGNREIIKSMDAQHGSHCVGIMMGDEVDSSGNKYNRIGVAPDAKWISARVFGDSGESSNAGFLRAAEWMLAPNNVAMNAPQIINNSWGGGSNGDTWFRQAVQAWRVQKILPVFAAGNMQPGEPLPGPSSISAPADYEESFAVGAVDKKNILGYFSKQGPSPIPGVNGIKPEVSAPGVKIRSAVKGAYAYMSGTSMAAPHVSGVAALIKEANPALNDREIANILEKTATKTTDSNFKSSPNYGYGYGVINAYDAISMAKGKKSGTVSGYAYDEKNSPITADITVQSTMNTTKSAEDDGKFSFSHVPGNLKITCSSTGYFPETKEINLKENANEEITFNLKNKKYSKVKISVVDDKNKKIEGAHVRIVEDSDIGIKDTDDMGTASIEKIYEGNYTLRVFKDGYKLYQEKISISGNNDENIEIKLKTEDDDSIEKEYKYDNDDMNIDAVKNFIIGGNSFQGGAVKFVPEYKGGTIKDCSIKFAESSHFTNSIKASVSIKELDKRGRTVSLQDNIEIDFEPGNTKRIELEKYNIKTDKPYYVVVEQSKSNKGVFSVGVDKSANTEYSYIFSGDNFIPLTNEFRHGGLIIRSTVKYPKNSTEINYTVNTPKIDPIYPSEKIVRGTGEPNQRVQLTVGSALKIDDVCDGKGRFEFKLQAILTPGEEIKCHGLDINGIKSKAAIGIVLTNRHYLNENLKVARTYVDKPISDSNKEKLLSTISDTDKLIQEIDLYEKNKNVDKKKIEEYQVKIDEKIRALKDNIIALSPDKKDLRTEIDKAKLFLEEVWDSSNGHDVPSTKSWVKYEIWIQLKHKIDYALTVYDNPLAKKDRINNMIIDLKEKIRYFESSMKAGKKEVIKIDDRFMDGTHDGEGKTVNSLLPNEVEVTIEKGKLKYIKIKDWKSSPESLKIIKASKFLEKIVESNSVAVKPVKGYEKECDSIISAIIQALEKRALKEGAHTETDKTPLLEEINESEKLLNKYKVSKDGKTSIDGKAIDKGEKWTIEKNHNEFKKAIEEAKKAYNSPNLTIDGRKKAHTKLYIAKKSFVSLLEYETIEDTSDKYYDGIYITSARGFIGDNTFRVTIKNGKISSVTIEKWSDTLGYDKSIEPLLRNIEEKNSTNVDVISKATLSSNSVKNAVDEALKRAKKPNNYDEKISDETAGEDKPIGENDKSEKIRKVKKEIFDAKEALYIAKKNGIKIDNTVKQKNIDKIKEFESKLKNIDKLSVEDINNMSKEVKSIIKDFKRGGN